MEIQEAILTRRSIRKYTGQEVTSEQIETMLRAAMFAPSARNLQSWQFIVVRDKKTLTAIPGFHPHAKMIVTASTGILICADTSIEPMIGYCLENVTAATQNLLLSAHGLGLGAVWLGIYPREERMTGITELFGLPEHIIPFSLISIGYPAEQPAQPERYLKERVHFEKW